MLRRSLTIALSLLALSSCVGSKKTQETDTAQPVPVRVRKPARVKRPDYVAASGTVEANLSVEAAFQVPGKVTRVYADEGQFVRKGQVLAELDGRDYEFAADGAAAQVQAAQATEQKAEAGPRKQELEQARIDYERWADEYRRMKVLYDRKSLAPNDFQKIEAGYNAARQRYDMAQEGARKEDIAAAKAVVQGAEAHVRASRKRLGDTRLVAPIDGFIAMRRIDAGETAGAGAPVFSVMNLDPVKVRVGIPESEIGKVTVGEPAVISIPSLDGREFTGRVELVGVAAEPTSRTYAVKIAVPNPRHVLRAGMVAEARIQGSRMVETLTIPGEAIVRDPQGVTLVYVYFPDRGRAYARRVQALAPAGKELEVSGLTGAELVVVGGQQNVREAIPVSPQGDAR